MSGATRKRVWTSAVAVANNDGFIIMLDQQPLRLPGGAVLTLFPRALADAVAQEWSGAADGTVGATFSAESLPLTRLAATLQERVRPNRAGMIAALRPYANSDLLCYRATGPAALAERQQAEWQPWLDWCATEHGIRMVVTQGVMPVSQPGEVAAAVDRVLDAQSDPVLTGLGVLVPALGSLVLGLALTAGALSPPDAARLALLDELDQLARWGADRETEARHALLGQEVQDAARFVMLSREAADGGR